VRLAEEAAGRVRGEVVSATPLDPAQLDRIRSALARRLGRELDLAIRVDPALLGGLVARVGDLVFDGSLRTQLAQLRAQLTGER
jgi:F-type H+-transporting ATPase subunit delta